MVGMVIFHDCVTAAAAECEELFSLELHRDRGWVESALWERGHCFTRASKNHAIEGDFRQGLDFVEDRHALIIKRGGGVIIHAFDSRTARAA